MSEVGERKGGPTGSKNDSEVGRREAAGRQ